MFTAGDTETITRIRPTGLDLMGDPNPGIPDELDIPGCLFAPGTSSESGPGDAARQATTFGTVYAPAGADITNTDQLRIRDQTFDITGVPAAWNTAGLVVEVRRTTG